MKIFFKREMKKKNGKKIARIWSRKWSGSFKGTSNWSICTLIATLKKDFHTSCLPCLVDDSHSHSTFSMPTVEKMRELRLFLEVKFRLSHIICDDIFRFCIAKESSRDGGVWRKCVKVDVWFEHKQNYIFRILLRGKNANRVNKLF